MVLTDRLEDGGVRDVLSDGESLHLTSIDRNTGATVKALEDVVAAINFNSYVTALASVGPVPQEILQSAWRRNLGHKE